MRWFAIALAVAACGDDGSGEENIDLEACEHLEGGPFVEVDASATADDTAPQIADDHMAYTVTPPGFVRFAAEEAGDFVFFTDADVDVAFTDSSGAAVTPEESTTSSDACATIQGRHVVPLEVGTYFLELTGTTEVSFVIEHADH